MEVNFTGQDISSDGGALQLREVDQQFGLTQALLSCHTTIYPHVNPRWLLAGEMAMSVTEKTGN